jgi:hypothetical protein
LEHLQRHAQKCAVQGLALGLEARQPASLDVLLVLGLSVDVVGLAADKVVILSLVLPEASYTSERNAGLVHAALLRKPAR